VAFDEWEVFMQSKDKVWICGEWICIYVEGMMTINRKQMVKGFGYGWRVRASPI
jgi:hypothetical protein